MTSQHDGELLFVKDPGTSWMKAEVLGLAGGVKVDDMAFITAKHSYLLVVDAADNVVYKIGVAAWDVGSAFSAMSGVDASDTSPAIGGHVGMLDTLTGTSAPITSYTKVFSPGFWWIGFTMNRSGSEVQIFQMRS